MIISENAIRKFLKEKEVKTRISHDFIETLENITITHLLDALNRAKSNKRKLIMAHDI